MEKHAKGNPFVKTIVMAASMRLFWLEEPLSKAL
jgi:hypothetical protein